MLEAFSCNYSHKDRGACYTLSSPSVTNLWQVTLCYCAAHDRVAGTFYQLPLPLSAECGNHHEQSRVLVDRMQENRVLCRLQNRLPWAPKVHQPLHQDQRAYQQPHHCSDGHTTSTMTLLFYENLELLTVTAIKAVPPSPSLSNRHRFSYRCSKA